MKRIVAAFILFLLSEPSTTPVCLATPGGHVLLISDIHFDPLSDPVIVKRLVAAPASQWPDIFAASVQGGYAHPPDDTNYPLLKSALSAAAAQGPFDFVIASGDYLRHGFQNAFIKAGGSANDYPAFATKAAVFVVDMVQHTLGAPVYVALGNNDSASGDYGLDPGGAFLAALSNSVHVLTNNPEAAADFRTAGFYALPHPTLPNEEFLVLNTVLWSRSYSILGSNSSDPGAAEIQWLSWKLYEAKTLAHKVVLVMHIPPGIDAYASSRRNDCKSPIQFWQDRYLTQFLELMQNYGDIVQIALAGHTHMDDFRVLAGSGGKTSVVVRITPAISPVFGNNPAFSVLNYDTVTGDISDIATYYLDLANGGNDPRWGLEYHFPGAYGYSAVTATNLAALAAGIHDEPKVRQIFAGYYAASARSPITAKNWPFYSCAETQCTTLDYSSCCGAPDGAMTNDKLGSGRGSLMADASQR
jgi:sphingomyelin phosphodiesterase acid-like 3